MNINKLKLQETENTNEISYFPTIYNLKISAIIEWTSNLKEWWNFSYLELNNLATNSINDKIENFDNPNIKIINDFPHFIPNQTSSNIPWMYELYKLNLEKICEYSTKNWNSLIIWFSSLWWYELLPKISEIIKNLKLKYDNLIFVIWWADFNALPDKIFTDRVFEYGIDIINIWGAYEFTSFIWNLWSKDKFYRDEKWLLKIESKKEIPKNIIFEHQKENIWEINPGKKIETTFFYDDVFRQLHFSINNNPCLNNCAYCANFIHSNTPLKDSDIDKAIQDFNNYISKIEDNEIYFTLDNPNPLQYIDKFERFVNSIDLSKIKQIWFFWDFMWMWNSRIYTRTLEIIDNLLKNNPNISITIHFWIDALHYENDWEFVWRTIWQKIAQEDKYKNAFKNFYDFFEKYNDNQKVFFPMNIIFHPNMDFYDYKERITFLNKYSLEKNQLWLFPLDPHPNTQIEKLHKWFYISEYEAVNLLPDIKNNHNQLNFWWHFFRHSNILDTYIFSNITWSWHIFNELVCKNFNEEIKKEFDEEIFYCFLKWSFQKLENHSKKTKNLIWRLKYKKRKKDIESIKFACENAIEYINFIITRENYIIEKNPDYLNEKMHRFFKEIYEYKEKLEKLKEGML